MIEALATITAVAIVTLGTLVCVGIFVILVDKLLGLVDRITQEDDDERRLD